MEVAACAGNAPVDVLVKHRPVEHSLQICHLRRVPRRHVCRVCDTGSVARPREHAETLLAQPCSCARAMLPGVFFKACVRWKEVHTQTQTHRHRHTDTQTRCTARSHN